MSEHFSPNYPTTIVSCFYVLSQPKHSLNKYLQWLRNFLQNVNTPIVIFSEGEMADHLNMIRTSAGLSETFLVISKPFSELKFSSQAWIETWKNQVNKSYLARLHNQELYRVWANKSFFVEEVIKSNPFKSDSFIWCDAGCWRDPFVAELCGNGWPRNEKLRPDKLHILAMSPIQPWLEKSNNLPKDITHEDFVRELPTSNTAIVGGTILFGDKTAWLSWIPTFEETLNYFIQHELFAGDDQAVIASTAFWLHKTNSSNKPVFLRAPTKNNFLTISDYSFGDPWFAFQIHFSKIGFSLETL